MAVDGFVYPPAPTAVPDGLTQATPKYKRHAIFAMLSLAGFVLLYLALMCWFAWTAYMIFASVSDYRRNQLYVIIAGACSAFLALFMAKGLVFVQKGGASQDLELKRADHPRLFAFFHAIAEEAGAPKPYRVFLSPRVNAAVFYDLTLLDLFITSRKNLEIGLGLVNVLTLSEFKAVLAHEFGHFAQKSMAVGRWVYVAQQVATQIVNKRDAFDSFLSGLSQIDLRVAWIGWVLQFIVWSLRSLIDTLLTGVILAQRALSREMEFQADLVSVSLCGSEALINALHKLSGADDAMDRAFNFAASEHAKGTPVKDVFAIQSRVLDHLRSIYNDPHYGAAPEPGGTAPQQHRVFKSAVAAPPRMWATHPANSDRENNAKTIYVPCEADERSAWALFPDADALREKLSAHIFEGAQKDAQTPAVSPAPLEESFARLDESYSSVTINKRYRGAYLGRPIAREFKAVAEMYADIPQGADLKAGITALYGQSFGDALEKIRELYDEKNTFEGLKRGYLQAPGGVVRWRGEEIAPRQLPKVLKSLEAEIAPLKAEILAHDRQARGVHIAAARTIGKGWDAYLTGLGSLIHYAEHWQADLADLYGVFQNVFAVVAADGEISSEELTRLINAGNDVYTGLRRLYDQAGEVVLDERTLKRSEMSHFKDALGEFRFGAADRTNIGEWLKVVDGWVQGALSVLGAARGAALQELLIAEDEVANWLSSPASAPEAPAAASTPAEYPRLMADESRPRQAKLGWWDRFQTADGWLAATARFVAALAIVGGVIGVGAALAFYQRDEDVYAPGGFQYYPEPEVLPPEQ